MHSFIGPIGTGFIRFVVVPLPNWPLLLSPVVHNVPLLFIAMVWELPQPTVFQLVAEPILTKPA